MAGSVRFNAADTVATFTPSCRSGEHCVDGDGVGGAERVGDADEQRVFVVVYYRGGGFVPVQYLAGRDADRFVGCGRYQRG